MILQALTRLYEDMADRGDIARQGWGPAKISYALCIDGDGRLTQILPLIKEEQTGKKTVLRPRIMELPAAVKRAVNILSNFLWDNSSYLLGFDGKGKPERSKECFDACAKLHHDLLDGADSEAAVFSLSIPQALSGFQPSFQSTVKTVFSCNSATRAIYIICD